MKRLPPSGWLTQGLHRDQRPVAVCHRDRQSALVPSLGIIGDCYDDAVIETFWGRMHTELLSRKRWDARIELASAMFEYVEVFHNRQRRHGSIGVLTPIEYEKIQHTKTA